MGYGRWVRWAGERGGVLMGGDEVRCGAVSVYAAVARGTSDASASTGCKGRETKETLVFKNCSNDRVQRTGAK